MDPTAQNNPTSGTGEAQNTPTNPILPGQFVVAGETPTQTPGPLPQPQPSQVNPQMPSEPMTPTLSQAPPAPNPDEMLTKIAQQVGGKAVGTEPLQVTQPQTLVSAPPPAQVPSAPSAQPEQPVVIPQNFSPTPSAPPPPSISPDPTPFQPPQNTVPPPTQQSAKMDKMKLILVAAGALVLVALIGFVVFFYLSNKPKTQVTIDNSKEAAIEDPSPLPKRTDDGFANIPQGTTSAQVSPSPSPVASPSPSP